MSIAFIQEFTIVDGDTSTTNYDAVVEKLDLKGTAPRGLILHSAGFDHDAGVFRIFDVWKPLGAREAQALPGGFGVVADDVIAGLTACAAFHVVTIALVRFAG